MGTGMIFNMAGGGGGTSLNFDVKTYVTENDLPASAKENTIAIISDTETTNWIFSAVEPENHEPGTVWIETDNSSAIAFNALKKNALVVRLSRAYQYIAGEFAPVEAYIYDGTSWVDFSSTATYLYLEGDTCDDLTGGYTAAGLKPTSNDASAAAPTITYGVDSMTITGSNSYNYNGGYVKTKNRINLAEYSKLIFEGSRTGVGVAMLHIWSDIGSYINEKSVKNAVLTTDTTYAEIDTSDLNDSYYIGFATQKEGDGPATINVTSLRLE